MTSASQLQGEWKTLYNWMVLDPTCECCSQQDLQTEVLLIVNAAMDAKPRTQGMGCIASSLTLLEALMTGLGSHVTSYEHGEVDGANVFGTTTTRSWIRMETHCYVIENVAWWWLFFRHQAVLVYPKCHQDGFMDRFATVIDLWGPAGEVWQSWNRWIGGMNEINKSGGRVRDGF